MNTGVHTEKKPGHLVLGENGRLYKVDPEGALQPHEQPHRRAQRERAERFRAKHQAPVDQPRRGLSSLFGRH